MAACLAAIRLRVVTLTRKPIAASRLLLPDRFVKWFAAKGWSLRAHQLELLARAEQGQSTLLIAPTGAGKTLARLLPRWLIWKSGEAKHLRKSGNRFSVRNCAKIKSGVHTLYISPLKALAVDIHRNPLCRWRKWL